MYRINGAISTGRILQITLVTYYSFLSGPLASALSNQFDFRPVAMAGGLISTIGLAAAAFSTNVEMLNGTLGIVGGE